LQKVAPAALLLNPSYAHNHWHLNYLGYIPPPKTELVTVRLRMGEVDFTPAEFKADQEKSLRSDLASAIAVAPCDIGLFDARYATVFFLVSCLIYMLTDRIEPASRRDKSTHNLLLRVEIRAVSILQHIYNYSPLHHPLVGQQGSSRSH
jgi:hypothetical protein